MFLRIQRLLQQLFSNKSPSEPGIVKILRFLTISADISSLSGIDFSCCRKITKMMIAICSALKW